ncbi:MAG: NAD-dependent epimerase/dehydratase family protein, partial [Bacteroidales bacterium]|jgi:dTDP-glucose 4,6-dehydratase/UDP-glucose 4-epimerase|nr:NAD-dependent epimerase/dehydratase family protein [Bacteroidales bacterium]
MNILIIGSCGFIGSHLCDFFEQNHFVYGVDLIKSTRNNFSLITSNLDGLDKLFITHCFDVCINASGNGSVSISMENPFLDFERNTHTVAKILELIRTLSPSCKYINLSTAGVYGNPVKLPISETDRLSPISPYGFHKYCSELLCEEYSKIFGISTINLRLFSIYGERLKKQLFWDIFQKTCISNRIELYGTGNETRDFIYIKDLVYAIDCVIKYATFNGNTVNVASGKEITIQEASSIFCSCLDKDIEIEFNQKTKQGDPVKWRADISILKTLHFESQYTINEGLKSTVQWLKENK